MTVAYLDLDPGSPEELEAEALVVLEDLLAVVVPLPPDRRAAVLGRLQERLVEEMVADYLAAD